MILGVDPGLASTGWAVIDGQGQLKAWGCVETKASEEFSARLLAIGKKIAYLVRQYQVDELAVEAVFMAKNIKTALVVAQAIGVIKVAARRAGADVFEYTPLQIKMAITGYGRADKRQIMAMVAQNFPQQEIIANNHSADAAACALTHFFSQKKFHLEKKNQWKKVG